jgi:hypothetical protein
MGNPTVRDITTTPSGYYKLACDGRHETPYGGHLYLYYTKREVIQLWREEHPNENGEK